jgi:hypothetical protein
LSREAQARFTGKRRFPARQWAGDIPSTFIAPETGWLTAFLAARSSVEAKGNTVQQSTRRRRALADLGSTARR